MVDNNEGSSQIIEKILKKHDISIDYASDGIDALYKLKNGAQYQAAIIDYTLPDLSGLEVIEKIRNHSNHAINHLPIVLMYNSDDDVDLASIDMEYHVKQHLIKPINAGNLLNVLSEINQSKKQEVAYVEKIVSTILGKCFK